VDAGVSAAPSCYHYRHAITATAVRELLCSCYQSGLPEAFTAAVLRQFGPSPSWGDCGASWLLQPLDPRQQTDDSLA